MAKILPIKGIRYNTQLVDPEDVTSPPYDVISPGNLDHLLAKHPKNVVRLILGQELPEDGESDNRYTRATEYMSTWLADGTLVQDPKSVFYIYEQNFSFEGQPRTVRGFIALVKLQDYDEKIILPHENILQKPKAHLKPLIAATNANLDSVYGLYPDSDHSIDAILDRIAETTPAEIATDSQGARHRLWVLDDEAVISELTESMADLQIVIADGHHRYQTSLEYRDEMRKRDGHPKGEQPYDYVLMTLVNLYSPDLLVLPTHRMVGNLSDEILDSLDNRLADSFTLAESDRDSIITDMEPYMGRALGIYRAGRAYLAAPKPATSTAEPDVFILHRDIMSRILEIDTSVPELQGRVAYTRDASEAMDAVDQGEYQIAFILNPISLEAVLEVVRTGQRMPQKSTYFYPKLLSGLVMRRIEW